MVEISVKFEPRRKRIKINGHAGSGPLGNDIVCAAVTILALTIDSNVQTLESNNFVKVNKRNIGSGNAEFDISTHEKNDKTVELILDTILTGYRILSYQYPDYVKIFVWGRKSKKLIVS